MLDETMTPAAPKPANGPHAVVLTRDWRADMVVHAVGLAAGTAGAVALVIAVIRSATPHQWLPAAVYVAGLLAMLGCSAAYNAWGSHGRRPWLRRLDHAAIFAMIAGTYTPVALHLSPPWDAGLAAAVWTVAGAGILLKLWQPHRIEAISVVLYLLLGWMGAAAAGELLASIPARPLALILAGGVVYSAGVVFHLASGWRYQAALWHLSVLAGATLHFFAVLALVAP
ncbi:MAG TPA: hemolysin III family protein [Reyranella sp.]|jgi:hemolysin III|nr:hemolysin III family protein [Reyranella sp.]